MDSDLSPDVIGQCPNCQQTVQETAKFCGECGTALPRSCRSCGHSNPANAKFCSECGSPFAAGNAAAEPAFPHHQTPPPAPVAPAPVSPAPVSHPERRHINVMFCDLVGSSELSTQLDPEQNREVIGSFLSCCATEIKRLDGMVATFLGDGILAYFGYPVAHEDDAERALRAGLAIIDAVGKLEAAPNITLQTRIGIASGVVVVGDLVREGVAQQNAVIGETTNLAARLQGLAEPNTMVISPGTYELVGALFDYRDLDLQTVKGFAEPVHARQVLSLSAVESRFEARNKERVSRILGRTEEVELIERRWEEARLGQGRVVLVSGEAGIGKSRIGRAMQERLHDQDYTCLTYYCSPYHRDSALYPIIGQMTRVAGIAGSDDPATKLAKLEALLKPLNENLDEVVPLFASLLSIPASDRYPDPDLTPQQLKGQTLAALNTNLKKLTQIKPVLMVFEDLQWIDATSLELLSLTVDEVPGMRMLLLATARPEFVPPWPRHGHVSSVMLGRLDNTQAVALVADIAGSKTLAREVTDQIVARADGIPLFVEELTKTVLESGLLQKVGDKYLLSGKMASAVIPATLHASLTARLDRLSSAKHVAQIGAAIGRQFTHSLIAAVSEASDGMLQDALDRLVDAELISKHAVASEIAYQFKHALVHDATYASLVARRRQQLHGRIASALEEHFPELVISEPETLARHFCEAGAADNAIELWQRAGERAISRCENKEALGHLNSAMSQLLTLPETPERAQREFQLQLARGTALIVAQGQSTPQVEQAYSRARALATHVEDSEELFPALMGMWRYYAASGAQEDARDVGELLQGLAERLGDSDLRVKACMTLGITLYHLWEMPRAIDLLREGAELYESDPPDERDVAMSSLGQHPGFMCAMGVAQIAWLLGETEMSLEWRDRSNAIARHLTNPFQSVIVHGWGAVLSHLHQDWPRFRKEIEVAEDLATRHHIPVWIAIAGLYSGLLKVMDGTVEEGLQQCSDSVGEIERLGYGTFRTRSLLLQAQAYGLADRPAEGLEFIGKAIEICGTQGENWVAPELHRIRGELLLKSGPGQAKGAEAALQEAIDIAKPAGIPAYQRRAAISMARARMERGELQSAKTILDDLMREWPDDPQSAEWKEADSLLRAVVNQGF